jgi:hypothetical protein
MVVNQTYATYPDLQNKKDRVLGNLPERQLAG